jgi:hypothetical protein
VFEKHRSDDSVLRRGNEIPCQKKTKLNDARERCRGVGKFHFSCRLYDRTVTRLGLWNVDTSHLIIGLAGKDLLHPYDNADNSIAGNGPHNPFLNQTAAFIISVTGMTAAADITSAIFSFGTTAGNTVLGVVPSLPRSSTIVDALRQIPLRHGVLVCLVGGRTRSEQDEPLTISCS